MTANGMNVSYMDKFFGTKKALLMKSQPSTFNDNWRAGSKVFGGWAMWHFIGLDGKGHKIGGYRMLETTDKIQ